MGVVGGTYGTAADSKIHSPSKSAFRRTEVASSRRIFRIVRIMGPPVLRFGIEQTESRYRLSVCSIPNRNTGGPMIRTIRKMRRLLATSVRRNADLLGLWILLSAAVPYVPPTTPIARHD